MNTYTDYLIVRSQYLPPAVAWNYLENFYAACCYIAAGISIVPIAGDGRKRPDARLLPLINRGAGERPTRSWKPYQNRMPTADEVRDWYDGLSWNRGIGAVCGAVSGGLEMIDIDATDIVEPWLRKIEATDATLLPRLVLCRTPRPGLHAYFRSEYVERSQHLATSASEASPGYAEWKTLIETRGEGSYAIVPPSPRGCHPSRRSYLFLGERSLDQVSTISQAERNLLFDVSREFGKDRPSRPVAAPGGLRSRPSSQRNRPGDDFNRRGRWSDLLQRNGWTFSHADGRTQYWRRPGKVEGHSATLDYQDSDKLFVFSSNASPLEEGRAYTKFEFLTLYEFAGDFSQAAGELQKRGYGRGSDLPLASSRGLRRRR